MTKYIEAARSRGFCAGRAILAGNPPAADHRPLAARHAERVAIAAGEVKKWSKVDERAALSAYDSARQLWQFDR